MNGRKSKQLRKLARMLGHGDPRLKWSGGTCFYEKYSPRATYQRMKRERSKGGT